MDAFILLRACYLIDLLVFRNVLFLVAVQFLNSNVDSSSTSFIVQLSTQFEHIR